MQRLAKFNKKPPEAAAPMFASVSASDIIRAPVVQRAIPLEFAPLLAPYKRRGRLSLRVEDMPQQARLSAGRNNGDGSWSLASDELEDLAYLVPANLLREHTLLLRIMAFEEGAASTLKVIHFPVPIDSAESDDEGDGAAPDAASPDPILHHELNKMQSLFAVRESELTQLRDALEQAKAVKDAELASARAAWELELPERLSKAVAQAKSEWEQTAGQKAQDGRVAQVKAWAEQQIAEEHTRWQAQAELRLETERQRWKTESQTELSEVIAVEHARWQAQTERRIEAERQRWKTESGSTLSEAVAQEHQRWQARTEQRIEAERERWKAESLGVLAQAEARWKVDEAGRSGAALAEWREQSSRLLADASQKCRELELALAEARARPNNPSAVDEPEADRLRGELTRMQSILAKRNRELVQQRTAFEQERERWQQDMDTSLSAASRAWKADEEARLAAMVARSRAQSDAALAAAISRYEAAERALAEARSQGPRNDDGYVEGLRRELSTVQAALVNREVELGRAKAAVERVRLQPGQGVISNPVLARNIADPDEEQPATGSRRGLVRDFIVAVCVIAPVIFFYPRLEIYLPDELRASITAMTGGLLGTGAAPAQQIQASAPPAPAVSKPRTALVSRAVNLRATPATTGTVVLTLQRGASVNVLERRGNWTLVEVPSKAGKSLQGFVYGSYLKEQP